MWLLGGGGGAGRGARPNSGQDQYGVQLIDAVGGLQHVASSDDSDDSDDDDDDEDDESDEEVSHTCWSLGTAVCTGVLLV
jgi:hypothetical protein